MKSLNQFLLIACVLLSTFTYSQTPKLKITEAYLTGGFSNGEMRTTSHADFQLLAPNSLILENNSGALDATPIYYSPYRSSGGFSLQTGIQFIDKKNDKLKNNPTIRLGLGYGRVSQFNGWSSTEDRTAYDTLIGQNTGEVHYLDSIKSKTINGNYTYERITLDASIIFRTNHESRWSVYGGLGFSFGMSINAHTTLTYREMNYTNIRGYTNNAPLYLPVNGEGVYNEHHQNKSALGGSVYVPLGVDFRLGDGSTFWNMFHLFAEAQPGVNFQNVPELDKTISQTGILLNTGIRVKW